MLSGPRVYSCTQLPSERLQPLPGPAHPQLRPQHRRPGIGGVGGCSVTASCQVWETTAGPPILLVQCSVPLLAPLNPQGFLGSSL